MLASFNNRKINLVRGKIHVLGDSLSRIPDHLSLQQVQCSPSSLLDLGGIVCR